MRSMNQSEQQKQIQKLLSTREGQTLLARFSREGKMHLAGAALRQGDTEQVRRLLEPLVSDPEIQRLLRSLEQAMGHG